MGNIEPWEINIMRFKIVENKIPNVDEMYKILKSEFPSYEIYIDDYENHRVIIADREIKDLPEFIDIIDVNNYNWRSYDDEHIIIWEWTRYEV